MPKSSRRFILSSNDNNKYGFEIVPSGIDTSYFKSYPTLYWMLDCSGKNTYSAILKGCYWTDIKQDSNEISAVPFFNDNDPLAMKLYNKVEHGSINAIVAVFDYLEVISNNHPVVLRSKLKYVSLSDGLNEGINAKLVNTFHSTQTQSINLSTPIKNMNNTDQPLATPYEGHLPAMKTIFKNAVDSGKFTESTMNDFAKVTPPDDKEKTDIIKKLIQKAPIKPELIDGKYPAVLIKQAADNTYDDIVRHVPGGLNNLKANAPELYKAKFFEKFGRLPGDVA
jgi:hypothetical protein